MRVLTTFGFVIATCLTSSAALAYEFNQPYIKLGAGLSAPGSKQVRPSTNRGLEGDWRTDFDTAGLYEVAAGFSPVEYLRTELAFSYRHNLSEATFYYLNATNGLRLKGHNLNTQALMVNVYLEPAALLNKDFGDFTPFVGVGVGFAHHQLSNAYMLNAAGVLRVHDGTDTSDLAWQIGAGVAYKINDSLVADVSYRLFDAGYAKSSKHYVQTTTDIYWGNQPEFNVHTQEVLFGLRFMF